MALPPDILEYIQQHFSIHEEQVEVKNQLESLWALSLNVGPDQLARSLLVVCEGKVYKLKEIIQNGFYGDPRDVIMMAEAMLGHPGHYFMSAFDLIKKKNQPDI